MPFVAPIEQKAMEKGINQGINQGIAMGEIKGSLEEARISLTEILEVVFGAVPASVHDTLQHLDDIDVVRRLRRQALKAASLDEFQRLLDEAVKSPR